MICIVQEEEHSDEPQIICSLGLASGDNPKAEESDAPLTDASTTLQALAQKRGMVAFHCATPVGQPLPDYAQRQKIENQVAKFAHEHLIVFTDSANDTQIWQWVKREAGKPTACREHTFHRSQQVDALLQKLQAIAFTLEEEEERLSLIDVTRRARAGFDVERITKRFYDRAGCATNDFLCSARDFLSPKFPLISEISSFSTATTKIENSYPSY
jgi:hypothetical protein